MRYFDFHTHIYFKQAFSEAPNLDGRISPNDVGGIPRHCTDLPNIIQTQIHQSQLAEHAEEVIAGVVLYGIESFLADEVAPLRKFLKKESRKKLSVQLLADVASNTCKAFTDFTMSRTLDIYLEANTSFNVLQASSFNDPLPKNKVNIFFVLEGCHSLVDTHNKFNPPNEFFPVEEIISNLDKLLAKAKVLSINLTHLQPSNLSNHAFGIQLTRIAPFLPIGNGLEDDGRKVAQEIFNRGICIDLKHMSFKSRRDLMSEIDAGNYQNTQPLLCTHTGFTGVPFSEWPGFIALKKPASGAIYLEIAKTMQTRNEPRRPGAPAFNMSTINLFDEEIAWIVNHDGMIGISLDRRIIGFVGKHDDAPTGVREDSDLIVDKEFISKPEWTALGIANNQIGKRIGEDDCLKMPELEENTEISVDARNEYFLDHVLLHIKHYFQACVDAGIPVAKAQKHVCFGTDFDGLINPFLNIQTVEDMLEVKTYILANFGFYLGSLNDSKTWKHELDIPAFVEDLFFNNGFDFVKSRMQN